MPEAKQVPMVITEEDKALLASVLIKGDISTLSPVQKWQYVESMCRRLSLDPFTQPFMILRQGNTEKLYATKACTEQLGIAHNVSLDIADEKIDHGCCIIKATASLPNGRSVTAKGVVSVEGLRGESFANALMKCETKACRRATLRLMGLGMMDESETHSVEGVAVEIEQAATTTEEPSKRGRPVGAKNKPKEAPKPEPSQPESEQGNVVPLNAPVVEEVEAASVDGEVPQLSATDAFLIHLDNVREELDKPGITEAKLFSQWAQDIGHDRSLVQIYMTEEHGVTSKTLDKFTWEVLDAAIAHFGGGNG